jgi:hypothetical protein
MKDLEGNGCGLMEVLFGDLAGGTKEKKRTLSEDSHVVTEIRTEHPLPNTSAER